MHILFIPSWYPKTPDDISGCFFREQAIALARAGHQVGVLAFYSRLSLQLGLQSSFDEGVQTWRIHLFRGISVYGQAILPFLCEFYFNRYCRLHGTPDVLHAQSALNGGLLAMKLSRAYGIPYIVTEHSTAFPRQLIPARSLVTAKKIFNSANDILAVSSMLAACLKESCALNKEIKVVPNILNENIFIDFQELTPDILHRLIERIEIKADGSPRIIYRFSDPSAYYLINSINAQHSTCVEC